MARFALVVPSESGLSYTRREEALIRSFEDRASEVHDIEPRVDSVRHAMHEGDFDVWHFAAHGSAPGDRSSDWRLHLDSREHLESADLHRVSFKTQPLVFLNACAVGRSERSLTGVAGLADKLIEEGAGAVIGPLWAVDDASAFSFARVLYQELWARTPLGEAARRARAKVREANPLDPTPLAYAVFGHPGATHPGPVDRRRHR